MHLLNWKSFAAHSFAFGAASKGAGDGGPPGGAAEGKGSRLEKPAADTLRCTNRQHYRGAARRKSSTIRGYLSRDLCGIQVDCRSTFALRRPPNLRHVCHDAEPPIRRPTIAPRLGLWDTVEHHRRHRRRHGDFSLVDHGVCTMPADRDRAMALWLVGGMIAWCGAVCYAELATTYPRDGGDYEYLNRAFGPWFGFLVRLGAAHDRSSAATSRSWPMRLPTTACACRPAWNESRRVAGNWCGQSSCSRFATQSAWSRASGRRTFLTVAKVDRHLGDCDCRPRPWISTQSDKPQVGVGADDAASGEHRLRPRVRAIRLWRLESRRVRGGRSPRSAAKFARALVLGIGGIAVDLPGDECGLSGGAWLRRARNTTTPAADVLEIGRRALGRPGDQRARDDLGPRRDQRHDSHALRASTPCGAPTIRPWPGWAPGIAAPRRRSPQ